MDLTKISNYLPLCLVIIILLFIYYKNDDKHFLNNILHKTTENFSTKQNLNIIKNIPKFIKNEDNLEQCVQKIRENKAEKYNRMVKTNQIMFDINEIKEMKDNDSKQLTRTQKIASLNCSYFDLENDSLNKSVLPQNNELFIT